MLRVSLADMDRETRENYSVVIQAKDMGGQLGGLAGTTTVNITLTDINDNPPVFDQSKRAALVLAARHHGAFPEPLRSAAGPEIRSPSFNPSRRKVLQEKMSVL